MSAARARVIDRYRDIRRVHRSIGVPGEETAAEQLRRVDPEGILYLAEELGRERAAELLEGELARRDPDARIVAPELPRIAEARSLALPEPPALNDMLDLAKKRARFRSRKTGRVQSAPIVYDREKSRYQDRAAVLLRNTRGRPLEAWDRWAILRAHFRVHSLRDPLELAAGLKWPIDLLVDRRWVEDDSPRELLWIATPTQEIDRGNRRVELVIGRVDEEGSS